MGLIASVSSQKLNNFNFFTVTGLMQEFPYRTQVEESFILIFHLKMLIYRF